MIIYVFFLFQAEDGIRDLVRSRGLGDVYKRQTLDISSILESRTNPESVKELVLSFKKENNLELTSVFVNDELTKQEYLNIYKEIGIKNIIVNSNVGGNPIIEDSDLILSLIHISEPTRPY